MFVYVLSIRFLCNEIYYNITSNNNNNQKKRENKKIKLSNRLKTNYLWIPSTIVSNLICKSVWIVSMNSRTFSTTKMIQMENSVKNKNTKSSKKNRPHFLCTIILFSIYFFVFVMPKTFYLLDVINIWIMDESQLEPFKLVYAFILNILIMHIHCSRWSLSSLFSFFLTSVLMMLCDISIDVNSI